MTDIYNNTANNNIMKSTSFANSSGNSKPLARRSQILNRFALLFAFCMMFGLNSWGQENNESWTNNTGIFSRYHANKWKENGLYAGLSPEQELIENRSEHSKTFNNGDGTFSYMYIGDLHYQDDNGSWQDIDVSIRKESTDGYKYANTTNKFKTYYSDSPAEGIMMKYLGKNLVFAKNYTFDFVDAQGKTLQH